MSKRRKASCNDCYFRRAGLCALTGDIVCPTFRNAVSGELNPPRQPQLIARPAAVAPPAVAAYA